MKLRKIIMKIMKKHKKIDFSNKKSNCNIKKLNI